MRATKRFKFNLFLAFASSLIILGLRSTVYEPLAHGSTVKVGCGSKLKNNLRAGEYRIAGWDKRLAAPKVAFVGSQYHDDFPIETLRGDLAQSDGTFVIGWHDSPSWGFREKVRLSVIEETDKSQNSETARRLWARSVQSSARGVEAGLIEALDRAGRSASKLVCYNDPNKIFFDRMDLADALASAKMSRDNVAEVVWWHTHPNGNPFSTADFIGPLITLNDFKQSMKKRGKRPKFLMRVVTKVDGKIYLYEVEPNLPGYLDL